MIEIEQTFMAFVGLTLFIGGGICCFISAIFRYGVFCMIIANLIFCSAIIFPKQVIEFVTENNLTELFNNVSLEVIQSKAIITGLIIMSALWGLRWLKHILVNSLLIFMFPKLKMVK